MSTKEQEAYREEMAAKLKKVKADLDKMEADMQGKKAGLVSDLLREVRKRNEDLNGMIEDLKTTSGAAFEATKEQISKAWNDFQAAFEEAKEKAEEKE